MDIQDDAVSLNNKSFRVVSAGSGSALNGDTTFTFQQEGTTVWAEYKGGPIEKGFLVGAIDLNRLKISFSHLNTDGTVAGGASACTISENRDGVLGITEHFEYTGSGTSGINTLTEITG